MLWRISLGILAWALIACHTTPKENANTGGASSEGSTSLAAGQANPTAAETAPAQLAKIEFEKLEHDFDKIREGEKVSYRFKFKNVGEYPLQISDVKPSCGCTTPDWTKTAVPPGGEGYIEVVFDSQGRSGSQIKTVTVFANTDPPSHVLRFKGEVIPRK